MKTIVTIVLSCFLVVGAAQKKLPKELHLNHLYIEDGLAEGHINKMIQDKEGYMWLGTVDGLIRYDGYTPKKYVLASENLRTSSVIDFCEDSTGEFWVADYYNGLCYYDRRNDSFTCYKHDSTNINSLAAGGLRSIVADAKGNLWLALFNKTQNEVTIDCFNIKTKRFKHFRSAEKGIYMSGAFYLPPIYMDKSGNIWSGSENGLQRYDYQTNHFCTYFATNNPALKKSNEVVCADPLNKNIVWTNVINTAKGNYEGLWRCDITNKTITAFRHHDNEPASLASDTVLNIQIDSKNQLWITTANGLSLYNSSSKNFLNYCPDNNKTNSSGSYINHFTEDKDGNFWFVTSPGLYPGISVQAGISAFDTKTRTFINYRVDSTQSDGLNSNFIASFYIDHSGCLWLNSGSAGVQWINNKRSKITLHAHELARESSNPEGFLVSAAEASDHTVWLATAGGLYHWFPAKDSFALTNLGEMPDNSPILIVIVDKQGLIWYCGNGSPLEGLYCYNPLTKETKHYRLPGNNPTLVINEIASILEDHTGQLWIGTLTGLFRFNKNTGIFNQYNYKQVANPSLNISALSTDWIFKIFEDKENTIWLGTSGSVIKVDRAANTFTDYKNRLPHFQVVTNFYEDNKQHLWASSYRTGGLMMFDKRADTIKRLSEKDGLLFNGAGTILADDKGNLWVKTVRGISIINPDTYTIRNLTDDVLKEENFLLNYSFKTGNGLFIFPSNYGFVTLNPNDFIPDSITPVVHIESVYFTKSSVDNKMEDSTIIRYGKSNINLHYNENRITFNYVGLMYQNTSQIQYKYKLDGYDNNWINANTQRTVTYTNLDPGIYTFRVTAANSDGVWSKQDDAITIVIAPPFWETWWFGTLVVLMIAGLIFFALRSYLNRKLQAQQQTFERLKAIEKVRSKISMDIHDEISSGLTKISLLSQRVENKLEQNKEIETDLIKKINRSSKEIIGNLGEIIWAVNPKYDNLQSLLAYIRNYTSGFLESTSVETNICFPEEVKPLVVSPDIKHNLFLVIKEALNNIVKHAEASQVKIHFSYTNEGYTLTITDNGKGMEHLNGRAFGNGFTNMNKRMEAIGGSLTIHSEKNKGTQLLLRGKFSVEID